MRKTKKIKEDKVYYCTKHLNNNKNNNNNNNNNIIKFKNVTHFIVIVTFPLMFVTFPLMLCSHLWQVLYVFWVPRVYSTHGHHTGKGKFQQAVSLKGKSERCVIKFLLLPLESKLDYLSNTLLYLDFSFRASDLHLHVASKFSVPDGFYICQKLVILFSCYPYNCSCPTPISFTDDW